MPRIPKHIGWLPLDRQEEITDTLGEQVKTAVEVLVQRLDQADADRGRSFLPSNPAELYEACLTVMMRLMFILCAEQRRLLLLGEPVYDQRYAASTLREKLQETADLHGEEILEHRFDAWSRLLELFRRIHDGFETESLRLPALGGDLFDPNRFPFLENLPMDNRTVLHLMTAFEIFEHETGVSLLSYRSLDAEQIGHVYEGLFDYTVKRLDEPTLGLDGTKGTKNPIIPLAELESAKLDGDDMLIFLIREKTKKSVSSIKKTLGRPLDSILETRINAVCADDKSLAGRIKPFGNLLRLNIWNNPMIYGKDSFIVTLGPDRRETGTHYTPKSLTEEIVRTTLQPLVYGGFSDGKPIPECRLSEPHEILSLKICDPAMGSGAFLVQVCRWLGGRLLESWENAEKKNFRIDIHGRAVAELNGEEPMSTEPNGRQAAAMRLVAERCLYGVDVNPLAVELAKLSIWLVTMSKGKPFEFLDHNFRSGDSLLGIHDMEQLTQLRMVPKTKFEQRGLFRETIKATVAEAFCLREELRSVAVRDIHDIEKMDRLNRKALIKTAKIRKLADAMIGAVLHAKGNVNATEENLKVLHAFADDYLASDDQRLPGDIDTKAVSDLATDLPPEKLRRVPFHWAIEFPEVFTDHGGFDAIVGNPPYLGGRKMRGAFGDAYLQWLSTVWPHASLNADLCTFFFLRAASLLRKHGTFGFLATNTIAQGDTARTGFVFLTEQSDFVIRCAVPSFPWPGKATVVAAWVVLQNGTWNGTRLLNGNVVEKISPVLDEGEEWGHAKVFPENEEINFQGSVLAGEGFVLTEHEAEKYLAGRKSNAAVIFPYLGGNDLKSTPTFNATRWVVDFRDYSLERCEKEWPELLERVRRQVKPVRDIATRVAHQRYWWHHGDKRLSLYERIRRNEFVFALVRHAKHLALARVSTKQVFQESLCILDLPNWTAFAVIQSTIHYVWAKRGSSTLGEGLRYTPSDYFDTFPFLHLHSDHLEKIGEWYYTYRQKTMLGFEEGFTEIYNRFHSPNEMDMRIVELRELHRQMDEAVAIVYGWNDLKLDHDFHSVGNLPANDRIRFTISEKARIEVLHRLSLLNHERYDEENSVGRQRKKGKR